MNIKLERFRCFNFGVLVMALCALLTGCVSVPRVEATKASIAKVKKIAVLAIPGPANVQATNLGGAAPIFGLVGGIIQGETNVAHGKRFFSVLRQQKPTLPEVFYTGVAQALKADGFDIVDARDQKAKLAADGKSDDYSSVHVDADAILSVWYGVVGYISQPYSTHYEPWVFIRVRLMDAKTKEDIYFKSFCVGYEMKVKNAVFLPAEEQYRYGNFDDIMAHSGDAIAGLYSSQTAVVRQVGSDLRP